MEKINRINYINEYLKNRFGERTLKIEIDGGFTCPNRDGSKGIGGCIFCSERGSGEHLSATSSIEQQLIDYFSSYKADRANKFILYFQNFSNTYAPLESLKEKYDCAIHTAENIIKEKKLSKSIVGIAIATRPDCISEEICKLLASYQQNYYVSVELGLQTVNDTTGVLLNRQYTTQDFVQSVRMLIKYKIDVVAHIMVGLPGETHEDIIRTVNYLNQLPLQGIKIHSTYVVKNTTLAKMYVEGKYSPLTLENYIDEATYILTHIKKEFVIHRISGDAPKDLLIAPEWNLHKKLILNGIFNKFEKENLCQGMYIK